MPSGDALAEFVGALKRNDADAVRDALIRSPELKSRLNDALSGLSFDSAPIHAAVGHGNRAMIDVLLEAGADINVRSRWWAGGFGVLDTAAPDLVPFLLERGARVDVHSAARLGMVDRLDAMVSAQPSLVHARGGDGQTPLHFAANVEIASYLLRHGADINARDVDHESTPAQYMVRDRQMVARYLVDDGCATDILMTSALGDVGRVRALLDDDPSRVATRVSDRYFPKQNPQSGGTIYIWTLGSHKSAHIVAREFGHDAVFDLLMDRSPIELQLVSACQVGDERTIATLLANHSNLVASLSDDARRTLVDAVQNKEIASVRRLLEAGWPVDARGQHGATALHWAAFHGNAELTRDLLQRGAPLDVVDRDFKGTPLDWAIHGSVHGWHPDRGDYAGTAEALLAAGAKPPTITADLQVSAAVLDVLKRGSR